MMKRYLPYFIAGGFFLAGIVTIIVFPGTADSGDSIHHYLYSRYAPAHPKLFFDLWAKPLAVLLSCPFAQFGFDGMKLYNLLVSTLALVFTFNTARAMKLDHPWLAMIFMLFSPLFFINTFSGLTEPLFAAFMMAGFYLLAREKNIAAALLLSFLPFVRQEGIIILGLAALYFAFRRSWRSLPVLLTGYVFFALAGMTVYKSPFWVIARTPYMTITPVYGTGTWEHFFIQLYYVIGMPVYILLGLGLLAYAWQWIRRPRIAAPAPATLVIWTFLAVFIFHAVAWAFGLFGSMGMNRVIVCVIPLIALIALQGYNMLESSMAWVHRAFLAVPVLMLLFTLYFPFGKTPASIDWSKDMQLRPDQVLAYEAADYIRSAAPDSAKMYYSHPMLSLTIGIDHFDHSRRGYLKEMSPGALHTGDLVIWDSHFSPVEEKITLEMLETRPGLQKLQEFRNADTGATRIVVFRYSGAAVVP